MSVATTIGPPAAGGRRRLHAYTMLEMILSTLIVSIIMAAIVSTMLMASRGLGNGPCQARNAVEGHDALQQITLDLSLSQSFSERTDRAVTFTVPDRDGDGQAETIRYAWSGTAGDPLTRQYNGGSAGELAEDVHRFGLDYLLKTVAAKESTP